MPIDFSTVTELADDQVTREQIERMCHRYFWAGEYCRDKDVIEVACGAGQGLGFLSQLARSLRAGDYCAKLLSLAKSHYGDRVNLSEFDAQQMPFNDNSADVVIIFEAIYYLPRVEEFLKECRRVLRNEGKVLVATANKDLYDFNPSPYSCRYLGVVELKEIFQAHGFDTEFFGVSSYDAAPARQRVLRVVKAIAVKMGLMPHTMDGKKLLKRLVFGSLVTMPREVRAGAAPYVPPTPLPLGAPDMRHKVIYCEATVTREK
jgi:SAM-dependent methyltransferase